MLLLSRRDMLCGSSAFLFASLTPSTNGADKQAAFEVSEVRTISLQNDRYHGWPTLTRRHNGELLVVCSGGRESHVCPFGRVEMIRSADEGKTWSYARTILDGPIDDRDAGIVETKRGTLLVTTFTSLAYEPGLKKAEAAAEQGKPTMDAERMARWQAAHRRLADDERRNNLGTWMIRSEDGGLSWSSAYRVPVNSPHGPVNLQDGRLLYAGIALWEGDRKFGVCTSADDGKTWEWIADLPVRDGDKSSDYHELHAIEAADGRWIVQIRNHNAANKGETLQTHSMDGGRTWVPPYAIGVWGLPSHLLRMSDDRLLMTYGHRRSPLGNQARVSADNGQSWSEPMVIYGDGSSGDLGYPSTVEVAAGEFITVWYEKMPGSSMSALRMAKWQLT